MQYRSCKIPSAGLSHKIVNGSVQWFNSSSAGGPDAFVDPDPGTYSPTRRGQNSNPGYESFDLAAIKTTAITERVKIQFKANMYNLFKPHQSPASRISNYRQWWDDRRNDRTISRQPQPLALAKPFNTEFALKVLF